MSVLVRTVALLLLWTAAAAAHKPSDAYLRLAIDGPVVQGTWDIALRDLDLAVGLDGDGDGSLTWGEVRRAAPSWVGHALAGLELTSQDGTCPLSAGEILIDRHGDGTYAVVAVTARCPGPIDRLTIHYRLFAELDRLHRGLVRIASGPITRSAVLGPASPTLTFDAMAPARRAGAASYVLAGASHVALGADHLLFVVTLLLPCAVRRCNGRWEPESDPRRALRHAASAVSAFTAAHSLTLALAATGVVEPPAALVERLVALTIVLAAFNNLVPLVTRRWWLLAFAFGLVHGLGFAGGLVALELPRGELLAALLLFNLGVELFQLGVVAALLPATLLLRDAPLYRLLLLRGGSAAIVAAGLRWLIAPVA